MRLIDADALIAEWCDGCKYLSNGICDQDICGGALLMKEAPTIDPESLRPQWIPVTERLPKEHQPVLFCRKGGNVDAGCRIESGWWKSYGIKVKSVTHWMPLPKPPQEG